MDNMHNDPTDRSPQQSTARSVFTTYLQQQVSPVVLFIDKEGHVLHIQGSSRLLHIQEVESTTPALDTVVSSPLANTIRSTATELQQTQVEVCCNTVAISIDGNTYNVDVCIRSTDGHPKLRDMMLVHIVPTIANPTNDEVGSNDAYENLFVHMKEGFVHGRIVLDEQGKPVDWVYLDANIAFETLTGVEVKDVIGRRFSEVFPDVYNGAVDWVGMYGETALHGKEYVFDGQATEDGHFYSIHAFQPAYGEWAAVFLEVSDLVKSKRTLEISQQRLKEAQAIANFGNFEHDFSMDTVWWSDQTFKILGFPIADMPPNFELFIAQVDPSDRDELIHHVQVAQEEGKPYEFVYKYCLPGSETLRHIKVTADVYFNDEQQPQGLKGTVQDVTHQVHTEQSLQREKLFSDKIASSMPCGVYVFNFRQGRNTFGNAMLKEVIGYSGEDLSAMSAEEVMGIFHPEDVADVAAHMGRIAEGEETLRIEYRIIHKAGHVVWCYSLDTPFERDENGDVVSYIGTIFDISENKRIEQELAEAKERAEISNRLKNQFLANMSHEIRTPLNGILGFSQVLEDSLQDAEDLQYVQLIKNSSLHLLLLISDIIDVSKIEAGELKLSYASCELHSLMTELEVSFREIRKLKGKEHVQLKCRLPEKATELSIRTDPVRLRQLLSNLLMNSIKFSDSGTIEFGYQVQGQEIAFFVRDEGVGIPDEKLELIFERFEQIDNAEVTGNDGTGLGLSICKGIVNLMNGRITVESKPKQGTTFTIVLPLEVVATEVVAEQQHKSGESKGMYRILVAEDNETNAFLLKAMLKDQNYDIVYVSTGIDAVEEYRNGNFDLVLMDIRMPGMNGYEAAEAILKHDPQAKLMAQTAFAMSGDEESVLNHGFVDYISKPIFKKALIEKINRYVRSERIAE